MGIRRKKYWPLQLKHRLNPMFKYVSKESLISTLFLKNSEYSYGIETFKLMKLYINVAQYQRIYLEKRN